MTFRAAPDKLAAEVNLLETPLLGLLEETLLPGEERDFALPALDPSLLLDRVGVELTVLTITSPVELPALVSGRHATMARVIAVNGERARILGLQRVRVVSAKGSVAPFVARVVPLESAEAAAQDQALLRSAQRLVAALAAHPTLTPIDAEALRRGLAELLRAVTDARGPNQHGSLHEALAAAADAALAEAPAVAALEALEDMVAQSAQPVPPELMRRLWSQCVELMKRLDIYEPSAGSDEGDIARVQRRLSQAGLPKEAKELAKRELRMLRQMDARHHDYTVYLQHLDWLARLPWQPDTLPPPDLDAVERALDREHTGLGQVKTRVLEYLAVYHLGGRARATVLCLVGPPGVGKTTIARAIASALGRKIARVALGGVHDEAELRGYRLSFVAAQPGRIVQALAQAGQANAVIVLDEIDKLGTERARSPTGALLEILDPEQNSAFHDNYLSTAIDLSHVLFICTANELAAIHPVLRDRLEVVTLEGYAERDKTAIARDHILPRLAREHALASPLKISDAALSRVIAAYTREAGVRELDRQLAALHRDRALARVRGQPRPDTLDVEELARLLGPPRSQRPAADERLPVGMAYGLSVTADGGQLLPLEVLITPGERGLRLTGRMGEVMRESAQIVLSTLRHRAEALGIDPARLDGEIHVHAPEGAVPKDGPSAGLALFVALLSAARGVPARADIALTGELTLNGRVLPVGGVKAKVLAAERAGLRGVILPADNAAELPENLSCAAHLARSLTDILPLVLETP